SQMIVVLLFHNKTPLFLTKQKADRIHLSQSHLRFSKWLSGFDQLLAALLISRLKNSTTLNCCG
ncbi:hypothetical protein ACLODM_01975, partial [Limosilactobacillus mucosae]|uniref:hypothetical protein n=1 Tax=Limosilactobacillus mucosae TaxID=97478 RepID=UPI003EB98D43